MEGSHLRTKLRILLIGFAILLMTSNGYALTRTISDAGGNWSATTTWAGGVVPIAGDDVVATATSGSVVVDPASTASLKSFDLTGYTGTLSGTGRILVQPPTGTTVAVKFAGTNNWTGLLYLGPAGTATVNLTTGGKQIQQVQITSSAGATVALQDDLYVIGRLLISQGIFTTNNHNVSVLTFNSNYGNTRIFNLGTSTITLRGTAVTVWDCTNTTGLTLNAASSTILASGSSTATVMYLGSTVLTYGNLTLAGNSGAITLGGGTGITITNLTFNITSANDLLGFQTSAMAVSNNFTIAGISTTQRAKVWCSFANEASKTTITCNGTWVVSYADFRSIAGAGTASRDLSAIPGGSGDMGNNTGFTFTPTAIQYWVPSGIGGNQGTGSWSDVNHWAIGSGGVPASGRMPLPQDTVTFDGNSFTAVGQVVTIDYRNIGKVISWAAVTNTPTWTFTTTPFIYGSLTLSGSMTFTPAGFSLYFCPMANATFTTNGKAVGTIIITNPVGILTLGDNLTSTGISIAAGNLNANGKNVTTAYFRYNTASTCSITLGAGTWTLNGTGIVWDLDYVGNTPTFSGASSTINITNATTTAKTFRGGAKAYGTLNITGGGTGAVSFTSTSAATGANTFAAFTINAPKTVNFTSGATQTITTAFTATGTAVNKITMNSTTAGSQATLSKTSGTVTVHYCNIRDSNATGGAVWDAKDNCTNVSNNSGWQFLSSGPGASLFLAND
jgi:hypothetical protein